MHATDCKNRETTSPAVALHQVDKSYSTGGCTARVLDKIDLTIARGECVFLVGPSGSGKSTLLSIIGCLLSPDAGQVDILGHQVHLLDRQSAAELRLKHLGFVFQRFHLVRGLTVLENIAVPLTLAGWPSSLAQQRAAQLLEEIGLGGYGNHSIRALSVGQAQRVALARALAAEPELVLADEPTASLDAATGRQALELLRRLTRDAGKTVIVVTHDPRILSYADRVLRVENGRLVEPEIAGPAKPVQAEMFTSV